MHSIEIRNARRWAPGGSRPWIYALLALMVAGAVREVLHPLLGAAAPAFVFCIAASLMEFYFGLAPALTVMAIGLAIADYVFVPPYFEFSTFDHADLVLLVTYPALTICIIALIERLRRAQYHNELLARVAHSRYEILLRADNERLLARRDADETHRLLRVLTDRHDQLVFILAVEPLNAQAGAEEPVAPVAVAKRTEGPSSAVNAASPATMARIEVQPGSRYADVHPDDIERAVTTLRLGSHRVRANTAADRALAETDGYQTVDAVCERFATPTGDFVTFRLEA